MQFHLYEEPRVTNFIETENRMVVARGWRGGQMGTYYLMGTEFQVCKCESSEWMLGMAAQHVNTLNPTELYVENGQMVNFVLFVFYNVFEKVSRGIWVELSKYVYYNDPTQKPTSKIGTQTYFQRDLIKQKMPEDNHQQIFGERSYPR